MSEDTILQWFAQYAYQPGLVYGALVLLMVASAFGFPAPEEITLVSTGLVCYMGSRPDLYPPPFVGAPVVNTNIAASLAFVAVITSDTLVYILGKKFGGKFLRMKFMERYRARMDKISQWTVNYGAWAAGIFRFTPGLRFPGHFACGMLGLSATKFIAVDGIAALLTVPTQVWLVAHFGEHILIYFKKFKIGLAIVIGVALLVFLVRYLRRRRLAATQAPLA